MQRLVVVCLALLALAGADECPDGRRCEDGQTCCNGPATGYECCPFDQATCCEDHMHCCPAGTTCDAAKSSCVNATASVPWVLGRASERSTDQSRLSKSFRMIKTSVGEDGDNICPDQSRCPPEFSCVRALTRFGCCPLAQGTSCSDGKHCCPDGQRCSTDSSTCIRKEVMVTALCSDGASECPEETTCCENPGGKWGCCPMPKAVCCEDGIHCCPDGSACDLKDARCISLSTKKETPMWAKLPARIRAEWEERKEGKEVTAGTVDGGGSEKASEGAAAITLPPPVIKLPDAVMAAGAASIGPMGPDKEESDEEIQCDAHSSCPQNATCCLGTSYQTWACCPLPKALCCADGIHCCPNGYQCSKDTCFNGDLVIPWYTRLPASPTVVQCDGRHQCPYGNTCCKLVSGEWGCCPLPQALCCADGIHCCPSGYQCSKDTCVNGDVVIPWYTRLPATASIQTRPPIVQCDGRHQCPYGNTCCKLVSGQWGCCPLPQALCCADGIHCCPNGYQCSKDMCVKGDVVIPWYTRLPATASIQTSPAIVQCDDKTHCAEHTTCCRLATGQWSCCPLPQALCCADGIHCCPNGYQCSKDTCVHGDVAIPWYTRLPASPTVVQCDGQHQCPYGNTCCKLATGQWSCCPLPDAVCCPDMLHCCPEGFTCDSASLSCRRLNTLQLDAVPLKPVDLPEIQSQLQEAWSEEKGDCKEGETHCKISTTARGCCPYPDAVCCSDMKHCCPTGHTCSEDGDCIKNTSLQWLWHMFSSKNRALIL